MVVRLAETLELSLRERNALLLAAGYAPLFPESGLDDESLRPVREALVSVLEGHMPYPAVVARPYGEVVAANDALALSSCAAPTRGWTSSSWSSRSTCQRPRRGPTTSGSRCRCGCAAWRASCS